jgi:uncharacterized membrane protein YbjE (DUF340 family)
MIQLLAILGALVLGYGIKNLPISDGALNKTLVYIVVLILFVMGYELGSSSSDLLSQLISLSRIVVTFTIALFLANFYACYWLLKKINRSLRKPLHHSKNANFIQFARESGKYVVIIIIGMSCGVLIKHPLHALSEFISLLLFILLFIIGHQMRANGVSLISVILNRNGLKLATLIIISSLIAGSIAAYICGIKWTHGLILSSGFGWYTLSSILTGNLIDQNYGAMAFFIDFIREVIAIILIPSLGQRYPASMVGYCGGTAMDFSLPVIKQNLHEECVILAISSGMLLSIAVPVLISVFAKL